MRASVQDSTVRPPRSMYSTNSPSTSTTSAPALRPGLWPGATGAEIAGNSDVEVSLADGGAGDCAVCAVPAAVRARLSGRSGHGTAAPYGFAGSAAASSRVVGARPEVG